jgi:hypothetical protein
MPFGSIFVLMLLILGVNWPLRALLGKKNSNSPASRIVFSPGELLTVYTMSLFAALISSPGTDNFFLTTGAALFYYSKSENGWAKLFYEHVPSWFAPGWDGQRYQRDVIDRLYNGGLTFSEIPWHAWMMMLIAWSVFLLFVYGMMFFTALMLRRQWLHNEALSFPLVQLPLQMVDTDGPGSAPPARVFWTNTAMWLGFSLAMLLHLFKGMNTFYPDWPILVPVNQFSGAYLAFPDKPWNVAGDLTAQMFLGAIGVAYLLTREVSFSFWVFFLLVKGEKVFAEMLGFGVASMPRDSYSGQPIFIAFQAIGGWVGMAALLLWTAREHLSNLVRAALQPKRYEMPIGAGEEAEPFTPRFIVFGFLLCLAGLMAWSIFAGINAVYALAFFGIYLISTIVLARVVIEGGFLYPQLPFSATEWMTTAMFSTKMIGAESLTKLTFMQPVLMGDMRTNVLPAFLHAMKIADVLKFGRSGLRRLMLASALSILISLGTTIVISLWSLYSKGGLASYSWFASDGPQSFFSSTAQAINTQPAFDAARVGWMGVGASVVVLLTVARGRLLWFPLHPIGYIMASTYPITRLWFPFFVGWLVKTLVLRFGGNDTNVAVRPFMIGLIFGNIAAMMLWLIIGALNGVQVAYWPA